MSGATFEACDEVTNIKKNTEKEFLTKLIDDHWKYIEGVLYSSLLYTSVATDEDTARIEEIEYHYKTAFEHGWRHSKEYHTGVV